MWDVFARAMRFGPYAKLLDASETQRAPLCAISGWAVAHGARIECLQTASSSD